MRVRLLSFCAALAVVTWSSGCAKGDGTTAPAAVQTSTITLGPELATGNSFHPSATASLPANWTGFCPVPSPSAVTLTAGNAYQIVNRSSQSVQIVVLPNNSVIETIAAGATGAVNVQFGAVSQPTVTYRYSVAGCTDTASGQSLFTITVNPK